jgi:hypothetical protein
MIERDRLDWLLSCLFLANRLRVAQAREASRPDDETFEEPAAAFANFALGLMKEEDVTEIAALADDRQQRLYRMSMAMLAPEQEY